MPIERTIKLLFLCLFCSGALFYGFPKIASAAPLTQELAPGNGGFAPPPLPPACHAGGTSIGDYERPACCVSGYVYLDNVPTDQAEVTVITQNGISGILGADKYEEEENGRPFFNVGLHDDTFNVWPGDIVTLTATYQGRTVTETFVARNTRGMQVDLVIPMSSEAWAYAHPAIRHDHAMAYDQQRQQMVLFGGNITEDNVQGDTWLWDNGVWTQKIVGQPLPPARWGHTMAYHAGRQQVLMFGGEDDNGNYLNDLWAWDGRAWLNLESSGATPASRRDHALVYDVERDQLLLFGGHNANGLGDTWRWDSDAGSTEGRWEALSPATMPAARYQHAMSYDPTLKTIVLYGGLSLADDNAFNDTWIWDGSQWAEQQVAARPPALSGHAMAYDPAAGVLLFGGRDSDDRGENAVWVWNGSEDGQGWIQREVDPDSTIDSPNEAIPATRADYQMVYDPENEQLLLFGGTFTEPRYRDLADTWALKDQAKTWQQVDAPPPFMAWNQVAMSYEKDGTFLAFGGNNDDSAQQNRTFRWRPSGWVELNPTHQPAGREGHRIARAGSSGNVLPSCAGSDILLFGGVDQNGTYLNDTWRWQGTDWQRQTPLNAPPARAYHTLSYDCQQGQWVLFGGLSPKGEPLNDLWTYNGTDWAEQTPTTFPAPRYQATLSYDPFQNQMYLFGGEDGTIIFNDLWVWDGDTWKELYANQPDDPTRPVPRAAHGAAYDPRRGVLVIAGGVDGDDSRLQDTWSWNGQTWQTKSPILSLSPAHVTSLDYLPTTGQLVGLLNQSGGSTSGQGIALYQVGGQEIAFYQAGGQPQATISFINPKDAKQWQTITFEGRGRSPNSTSEIVAHRWKIGEDVQSREPDFTIRASKLPLGLQTLTYQVQDDEGNWSVPVKKTLIIREDDGSTGVAEAIWTILIYAAADNDLGSWLGDSEFRNGMLYRMQQVGAVEGVQVGILYDGPSKDDTMRYTLTDEGEWSGEKQTEADMGNGDTLDEFIRWGYETFESDYYALHIASHANGITGIGLDEHGDKDDEDEDENRDDLTILTPLELREGLLSATRDGTRKLDLLHFDGCSFGLLENMAIADGAAHFVVASANTMIGTFDYDIYRNLAAESQAPQAYGEKIMEQYVGRVQKMGRAYTIALFDMSHFDTLTEAVGNVGSSLSHYVRDNDESDIQEKLQTLRLATQSYDSGGLNDYEHDEDDEYVDLGAWLDGILAKSLNVTVTRDAELARSVLDDFIVKQYSASGTIQAHNGNLYEISLEDATGLGIYYPPRSGGNSKTAYNNYIHNQLFHITAEWDWLDLIKNGVPVLSVGPNEAKLMSETRLLRPIVEGNDHNVYLPLVTR